MAETVDNRTKKGREAIDNKVAKRLGKTPKSRAEIAEAVNMDPDIVSASLKRLEEAGRAVREGERSKTRYTAPASS